MTSRLVVIRHGKPNNGGFAEDALRTLSDEGRQIQQEMTLRLKGEGIIPDILLTSPLIRAQQTAEIISNIFGIPAENEPALGVTFNIDTLMGRIPSPETNQTLFIVGHMPTLAEMVNALVGEIVLPQGISKSAAAVVDFDQKVGLGAGTFIHYYKP